MKVHAVIGFLLIGSLAAAAQSTAAGVRLESGIAKEDVDGDLKSAIDIYQKIAADASAPRDVRSKALLRLAGCYEKLGRQARQIYEQVVHDFADQPAATQARTRLAMLRQGDRAAVPATMMQRKIDLPVLDIYAVTDGQREIYLDYGTGELMTIDLGGKIKRLIFKPKDGDDVSGFVPSRDFSMVTLFLRQKNNSIKVAVVRTDGSGYREPLNTGLGSCYPHWSWDDRYLFVCTNLPDGKLQLSRISIADGEIRNMRSVEGSVSRISPDSRYVALGSSPTRYSKVFVAPSEGGEPQLVSDSARVVDWTRDGRYLIVASARSSSEALYLLPIKDGRVAGDAIHFRTGPCRSGLINTAGALVCQSAVPGGIYGAFIGTLDDAGRLENWRPLDVRVSGSSATLALRWSPDSTQIVYGAPVEPGGIETHVVRLRNMATGEERELYKGANRPTCIWASQSPSLICSELSNSKTMDLFTIALGTGHIERIGSINSVMYGKVFFASPDDKVLYLMRPNELFRWDTATQQETTLEWITGFGSKGVPVPTQQWHARHENGRLEIRPASGGDWKPLISLRQTQSDFSPDGKWVYFHEWDTAETHGLYRISTAGGQPERVGSFPAAGALGGIFISPDQRKIIAEAQVAPEVWLMENFEPKPPGSAH